ncbi:hypothetical protein PUN28_011160 [Cardiocondyla obscurior]|uniref:G-patch domain-containing protein n=1 Tax=Cardiocondyla obscurior TaxID=286306 RepID=A0AAW2FL21_9HYME
MSMLAERRHKQKWTLNPRGKWWVEDSNKFGQRMLEKMGWTKGKGLGANEQGITEFSRMQYRSNTTGIGYDNSFQPWTENKEKFDNFLQQLNGVESQDAVKNGDISLSGQSIEQKSKQSHARVHYKKFTRGKDVNKYKSKELANIFGQKELTENNEGKVKRNDSVCKTEASGSKDNWYGVVTINEGNMNDYFKFKSNYNNMSNYSKYHVKLNDNISLSNNMSENQITDSESENVQHVGFGYTLKTNASQSQSGILKDSDEKSNFAFDNPCLGLNTSIENTYDVENFSTKTTKKRKKKFENDSSHIVETTKHNRKKLKTEIIDSNRKIGFINPALNLDTSPEKDCNGKEFEVFRTEFGLENCGLDLTDEKNDKKRVTFKKGEATLDKFEVENKKSKKKRKHESTSTSVTNGIVNEALDVQILQDEINDNELNEYKNKKTKKRKIRKTSNLETIQESPEREMTEVNSEYDDTLDISIVENEETDTGEKSKKKKKKKKEKEEKKPEAEEITVLYVANKKTDIEINETSSSKKTKKDKKNKEGEITNTKKDKKKKKKDNENCKHEKHTIQTEINNQDIQILDELNSRQQSEDGNKSIMITETSQAPTTTKDEEEKEAPLEKIKHKKKKRKSISKEDCLSQTDISNVDREISDKENANKEQDPNITKLTKKEKKHTKSKDKNVSNIEISYEEVTDINVTRKEEIEIVETADTSSKKSEMTDAIENVVNSPWSVKARMSKRMLITLFHNDAILEFPGSNIHQIKGYGTDAEPCEELRLE